MEFDYILESDSPDNAHRKDESIINILPPDRITDSNDDPNSRSKVAGIENYSIIFICHL